MQQCIPNNLLQQKNVRAATASAEKHRVLEVQDSCLKLAGLLVVAAMTLVDVQVYLGVYSGVWGLLLNLFAVFASWQCQAPQSPSDESAFEAISEASPSELGGELELSTLSPKVGHEQRHGSTLGAVGYDKCNTTAPDTPRDERPALD